MTSTNTTNQVIIDIKQNFVSTQHKPQEYVVNLIDLQWNACIMIVMNHFICGNMKLDWNSIGGNVFGALKSFVCMDPILENCHHFHFHFLWMDYFDKLDDIDIACDLMNLAHHMWCIAMADNMSCIFSPNQKCSID